MPAIDQRLNQMHDMLQRTEAMQQELLSATGGSGGGSGMDQRVSRLEAQYDRLSDRIGGVETKLATLTERVAHLPTKDYLTKTALAIVAAVTALITFADKLQALVS